MTTKCILLAVADPQASVDITQALGPGWEATSVATESDAAEQLEKRSFDALLVDFNLGSPDASELLNHSLQKHPDTARFLLAHEADLALVAAKVDGSHQILPKPIEPASLKSRIEEGFKDSSFAPDSGNPVAEVSAASSIPSIYSEVLKLIELPDVTSQQVGKLIGSDAALTTEVLRLSKSSYMGLPRNITNPAEAVESLGLIAVKALVLALKFLAEHSHLKPGYLSIDKIWQHSTNVAQIARDLVLFETKDRELASEALAAGLLHDLGKVVLVTNFDDLYGRVHSLARKQPVPLWEIEKEMFGANHGEIGGCLVGMWNLPIAIVDATALHHDPASGEDDQLTPLAAVHIANVLERQLRPGDECRVAPIINTAYLNQLGLLQRLPVWRATYGNRGDSNEQPLIETDQQELTAATLDVQRSARTANQLAGPVAGTRTATLGISDSKPSKTQFSPFRQKRWVYGSIAAAILFVLALWLRAQPDIDESELVYARTPVNRPATTMVPTRPEETPATSTTETESTPVAHDANPSATALSVPGGSKPEQQPTSAVESHELVTNVPPPSVPAKAPARPEFRLSGIIYGVATPSAIVNGKTVFVGDRIGGATVLRISQTDVTLQIDGQRKVFDLR
jgi:HD-like signal output (HDOD) protein